ncbi:unnamed protein product [Gongylonema pulchrum]|uniref:Transposase n=1 Tax=Gongylonema pulchrum TaxID=637853 RepID=A0A183DHY6_9BILA|nr:unnamed protein product [Gongylonema pulchrum]
MALLDDPECFDSDASTPRRPVDKLFRRVQQQRTAHQNICSVRMLAYHYMYYRNHRLRSKGPFFKMV